MADTKTSDESAIGAGLDGTEEIRLAKAGANYKATVNELLALVGGTDITLSALQTLQAAGTMTPGWYHITDRDIWVEALNGNSISPDGKRLMYCPATYAQTTDGDGNVWLGVWNSGLSPTVGDLAIWGGKAWKNNGMGIGTSTDDFNLDDKWTLVDKTSFVNNEYIQLSFGCSFDIVNDWVFPQWDDKGNVHGVDYLEQSTIYNFPENPVDFNDWNLETSGTIYANNQNIACFNNIVTGYYYSSSNILQGSLNKNSVFGMIYNNNCYTIRFNQNYGSISNNNIAGVIDANANKGRIADNTNAGGISFNINSDAITSNSNNGLISKNSNFGYIYNNSNNGNIISNDCLGFISDNTSNVTEIQLNKNIGTIDQNSNVGEIGQNLNRGAITLNTSGAFTCNIEFNTNNGNIHGAWVTDVTDPVVNK